ncbi:MCP four helix bundle domain-containing protein [uncultured Xylophilus sp.]|uniref:MCP four helix bundle domain-containing protein n=1 Tax=uncultured Xylophilus sp. TaxID=296832 RepID=UPI0025E009F1|nr:MCP four helix bundle domain-containing protein [uncultured Xylophilus sp.]
MTFANLKIGSKLGTCFAALTAITLLLGALAFTEASKIYSQGEEIATNWMPSVRAAAEMRIAANQMRRTEADSSCLRRPSPGPPNWPCCRTV